MNEVRDHSVDDLNALLDVLRSDQRAARMAASHELARKASG